jgi:hypothetical protein
MGLQSVKRPGDNHAVPSIQYDRVTAYRPYSLHLFVLLQTRCHSYCLVLPYHWALPSLTTRLPVLLAQLLVFRPVGVLASGIAVECLVAGTAPL